MNNNIQMTPLTKSQMGAMVAFGIIGWFVAAMVVRYGGPIGIFEGSLRIMVYIGIGVAWIPFYNLIKKGLKLTKDQVVPAIAIGTSAAALCDGIAMPWASFLYGGPNQIAFLGAAWILWFVGIGLAIALVDTMR